jgi:hypothetical protein
MRRLCAVALIVLGGCAGVKSVGTDPDLSIVSPPADLSMTAPPDLAAVCVEGNPCTTTNPGECARG